MQTVSATLSAAARVREWLRCTDRPSMQIAREAGVDDKTIRNAIKGKWNPTVETLAKLEALIPTGWQPGDPIPEPTRGEAA